MVTVKQNLISDFIQGHITESELRLRLKEN